MFGNSRYTTRAAIWVSHPSSIIFCFVAFCLEKKKRFEKFISFSFVFHAAFLWELNLFSVWPNSEFALIRGWTLVLYGSVISPQKDDEPRHSSSSPSLSNNNNNNYSPNTFYRPNANNNYGTTSLYTNRNQQKSTTVPAQAAARKNGKQKNGKGNKNNQRTSTTPRPIYTTVMLNQFSTGAKLAKNKSKASQNTTSASYTRVTSTIRPRTTTARLPNAKANHLSFGKNNNLLSLKVDKLEPANSNLYEKSPGKAPKQVKEGSYTTPSSHDTRPSPNLSMSQMFERYEKIEQIFPELKPYKDNNNPAYFTVSNGNGKPSRENSKSFSSFISAPQKKNSPSDISTATRQQVLSQTENEKNAKGTKDTKSIYLSSSHLLFVFFSFSIYFYRTVAWQLIVLRLIDLKQWIYPFSVVCGLKYSLSLLGRAGKAG